MGCLVPFCPEENNPDFIIFVDKYKLEERICCRDLRLNYDKLGTEAENLSKTDKNHKTLQEFVRDKTVNSEIDILSKQEELDIFTLANSDQDLPESTWDCFMEKRIKRPRLISTDTLHNITSMSHEDNSLYWNRKGQRTTQNSLRSLGEPIFPTTHQDKDIKLFLGET